MNPLALTVAAAVAAQLPNSPREELKLFQGSWAMQSIEQDGRKLPEEEARKVTLIITDKGFAYTAGDSAVHGTFAFDQRKDPKQIDFMPSDGQNKGKTRPGIYRFDDDTLTICLAAPDGRRPDDFSTGSGGGQLLYILKRAAPDAAEDAPKNP